MSSPFTRLPGRGCGGCTMCCTLLNVLDLAKPAFTECSHCETNIGCKIYQTRPGECAAFYCQFLTNPRLGDEWKPTRSGMVVNFEGQTRFFAIMVDEAHTGRWREAPYYAQIKRWAADASILIMVHETSGTTAIFPDEDVFLGKLPADHRIAIEQVAGPNGPERKVTITKLDNAKP